MSHRTIMAGVSGGSATGSVAETCGQLAGLFGGHVDVPHVRADAVRALASAIGNIRLTISAPLTGEVEADIATRKRRARTNFDKMRDRHGFGPGRPTPVHIP